MSHALPTSRLITPHVVPLGVADSRYAEASVCGALKQFPCRLPYALLTLHGIAAPFAGSRVAFANQSCAATKRNDISWVSGCSMPARRCAIDPLASALCNKPCGLTWGFNARVSHRRYPHLLVGPLYALLQSDRGSLPLVYLVFRALRTKIDNIAA